jgi:hypothetical protein
MGVGVPGYNGRIGPRHSKKKIQWEGRWSPPQDVLKVNIDGASQGNRVLVGIGGIGFNSVGDNVFLFSIYKGQ